MVDAEYVGDKRGGLGTDVRLCGFRRQRARSEQLKEDSKSAYLGAFCVERVPV